MNYELIKKETGRKNGKYNYVVVDGNGQQISERVSDRDYVACTIHGQFYFGRLDLIGKGDHGRQLKFNAGYRRNDHDQLEFDPTAPRREATPIAYINQKISA